LKKLIFVLLLFSDLPSFGQVNADSLWGVWIDQTQADSNRFNAFNKYIWEEYLFYDPDSAYYLAQVLYDSAKDAGSKQHMAKANNTIGVYFAVTNQQDSAIFYYEKSIVVMNEIGDKKGIAATLNNIGAIYHNRGDLQLALSTYLKSRELFSEIEDQQRTASLQTNLGQVYADIGDYNNAIKEYNSSLKIFEELDDKNGIASTLNLIGIIYNNWGEYKLGLVYFRNSLKIYKEISDKHQREIGFAYGNIATSYSYLQKNDTALMYYAKEIQIIEKYGNEMDLGNPYFNIGTIYDTGDQLDSALFYFYKSLVIYKKYGDKSGISANLNHIGSVYLEIGNTNLSIKYFNQSLGIAKESGYAAKIMDAASGLYKAYKIKGNSSKALEMHELYVTMHDSIKSDENRKAVLSQEYRYAYEKKAATDSIRAVEAKKITDAQITAQQAQLENEQLQRYALYGGVFMLLIFGGFIYNRFRVSQQQKQEIEAQKQEVEKQKALVDRKNEEITDSIIYAKRIQGAILPPGRVVKEYLKDSFIIYKPKDVVAGDFYWMKKKDGFILFAAADCTGHGVPGAMVSVVCSNSLNRSVREYGLTEPGLILDIARNIVVREFEKSDKNVQDGMDIALCSIKDNKLQYSGANIPLWIYRKGELMETKANKQPIGKFDNPRPFTTHNFELQEGDTLYLLSDGFVDQFGGERGKKFKVKALKDLLLSIQDMTMDEQKTFIDNVFEKWRGNLEQVDDVCFIGVRV
jgi:serine phosphatase RsbU (regulator of sigma subunit)